MVSTVRMGRGTDSLHGHAWGGGKEMGHASVPTTGTHLFNPWMYSYSVPSSVSRIHLSSSLEKEIRGSLWNSEGDCGKPDRAISCSTSIADNFVETASAYGLILDELGGSTQRSSSLIPVVALTIGWVWGIILGNTRRVKSAPHSPRPSPSRRRFCHHLTHRSPQRSPSGVIRG